MPRPITTGMRALLALTLPCLSLPAQAGSAHAQREPVWTRNEALALHNLTHVAALHQLQSKHPEEPAHACAYAGGADGYSIVRFARAEDGSVQPRGEGETGWPCVVLAWPTSKADAHAFLLTSSGAILVTQRREDDQKEPWIQYALEQGKQECFDALLDRPGTGCHGHVFRTLDSEGTPAALMVVDEHGVPVPEANIHVHARAPRDSACGPVECPFRLPLGNAHCDAAGIARWRGLGFDGSLLYVGFRGAHVCASDCRVERRGELHVLCVPRSRLAMACERAVRSFMRALSQAQLSCRQEDGVDIDLDGVGEYALLAELVGPRSHRPHARIADYVRANLLHQLYALDGEVLPDAIELFGYRIEVWLPRKGGGAVRELASGFDVDAKLASSQWCAYAWPLERGLGTHVIAAFEEGILLQTQNRDYRYCGRDRAPDPSAALRRIDDASARPPNSRVAWNTVGLDGRLWIECY